MIIVKVFQFWETVRQCLYEMRKKNWINNAIFFPITKLGRTRNSVA